MSVDKPVRPASEVARLWLLNIADAQTFSATLANPRHDSLTKLLEARDAEVRAAALEEAGQIAIAEAMNTLHRVDVKTRDPIAIGEIQKMIDLIAKALVTRSTEERPPGPYHCDCGAMLPHEPGEAARCKARSRHKLDELMRGEERS